MDHYLLIFAVLFDVFLWVIGNIADLAIYICFWRNFMKYEATSLGGKKIQGELVYEGLDMYIVEDHGYGTSMVQCVPGTERELKDDER